MNTVFETNFTVMPGDCNYHQVLIFGGAFFSQMDLCAAQTVNRFLYDSYCEGAVTHKVLDLEFSKPCYIGDLIYLRGEVVDAGKKSIVVEVNCQREKRGMDYRYNPTKDKVASAKFIFVSIGKFGDLRTHPDLLPYANHGLTLQE